MSRHLWPVIALPFALAGLAVALALRPLHHREASHAAFVAVPGVAHADALSHVQSTPKPRPVPSALVSGALRGHRQLPGARYSASYGCCILALSGHRPHLPSGWTGGDRLAIHGGGPFGSASSARCVHASDRDLRRLMRDVPLGAPVTIRT